MAPALSLLVLTEDTSASAHQTWVTLLKKSFGILVDGVRTDAIRFEPQEPDARAMMGGNFWRSTRPRDSVRKLLLWRTIATKLLEEDPPGFVAFHVDGDTAWSERASSSNVAKYDAIVLVGVGQVLTQFASRNEHVDVERAMRRLLRVTPFYSVEAWLYQAIDEIRSVCTDRCGKHVDEIEAWRERPEFIDEVLAPKDFLHCVADKDNAGLARVFPAKRVFDVNTSFAACVIAMLGCDDLTSALAKTYG